jgi:phage terminase large subunit-like protein
MHLTGRYPNWWDGVRFDYGGWEAWVGSIDNDMQRRGPQRALLGRDLSQLGTGLIPADALADKGPRLRQAGVKDVIDTIVINHSSGRPVTLKFLTFEQGWRKWQSGDPKIILWDEEPDETNVEQKDILAEALTRLVRNNGIFMAGYTPLLGETQLTRHFMDSTDSGVWWIGATWDDAPHMDEEQKKRIESQYPAHQREARTKGIPMVGEGLIFQVPESSIVIDPIHIPDHWARICGVDFGMSHPAAAAWLAWDRDTKTIYLYDCWREANTTLEKQAKVIKARGDWIPVSWPHDGEKRDPKSGQRFADILREHGVNVLSKSARYKNDTGGPQPQWPVIEDLRELMEAGQFRVFRTCKPWLEEYRSYHIKDGQIVSRRDDALKASFYAKMMLRYAVSEREGRRAFVTQSAPAPFTTAVH